MLHEPRDGCGRRSKYVKPLRLKLQSYPRLVRSLLHLFVERTVKREAPFHTASEG